MSMSKEHYLGRLATLREVYNEMRGLERISSDAADYCVEEMMYNTGFTDGFKNSADMILLYVMEAQYHLRRICGVPTKSDLIFGR